MANARLLRKLARTLQPMIEPAEQKRVRVEQRLGAEARGSGAIAPGNMDPRTGNQELVFARGGAARVRRQSEKTVNAAFEISVVPAGDVERGDADTVERLADVE